MLKEYRDSYSVKYGSPFAAFMFDNISPQDCDEDAGSVCEAGWVGRIGRRIMFEQTTGFADVTRYPTEAEAEEAFAAWAREWDHEYGIDTDTTIGRLHLAIREHSGMDDDQLREAGEHGADAGWPGFTYTADAVRFYNDNRDAIWELAQQMADDMGMANVPALVASFNSADMADTPDGFANLLAWFALEEVGRSLEA